MKLKSKRNVRRAVGCLMLFATVFVLLLGVSRNKEGNVVDAASSYDSLADATLILESVSEAMASEVVVSTEVETTLTETKTQFTVTSYQESKTMYTSDRVNIRSGAGTDYDIMTTISSRQTITVIGETNNGWYQVEYNGTTGYIMSDYVVSELPGTKYVFVGDSRTVGMGNAIGGSDNAYIAKVGSGYSWFSSTAINQIMDYAGPGTSLVINFGVNDLANASKYIELINSYIDEWEAAGITVYYASVNPVGSTTVTNEQIAEFNATMKAGLDSRITWIDSYSYLMTNGYGTSDGLHYTSSTYQAIYNYYISAIAANTTK